MKIVKPLTLGILHKPCRFQGQNRFVVAAIGFFRLGQENGKMDERFLPESLQWPRVIPLLPRGVALDEVMPKAQAEVLILASAHAPKARPVTQLQVSASLSDASGQVLFHKTLHVSGARQWQSGLFGSNLPGAAQPFTSIPLTWHTTYGGAGFAANPDGIGYPSSQLSRILGRKYGPLPHVSYPDGSPTPASFAPIPVTYSVRSKKMGSYHAADGEALPRDLDWTLFNQAPADQWLDHVFSGGERYCLTHLHPAYPQLGGTVPHFRARAFIVPQGQSADSAREVPMQLDTLWLLPEQELGVAIYHGQIEIQDSDALDVAAVMVAYESPDQPRTVAHYRQVLALRLDPATAALHAFNESQLAPIHSAPEQARRQAAQAAANAEALARQQARLDLIDAEYWKSLGTSAPPDHTPPKAEPSPFGMVSSAAITEGDFDLSAMLAQAKTMAANAQAQGQQAMQAAQTVMTVPPAPTPQETSQASGNAPKQTPATAPGPDAPVDPAQLDATLERAARPAYDLLPPDESGVDPLLAQLLAQFDASHPLQPGNSAAVLAANQDILQQRQAILALPAQKRAARRAAPAITPTDLPLPAPVAQALGQQVRAWLAAGVCLAGRDLAGANLQGVDFSAQDLRQVLLEGADLSGANLAAANLHGAVLTGARLNGARFTDAMLQEANLCLSQAHGTNFERANLNHAMALSANWQGAHLDGANLDDMVAANINLSHASLSAASVRRTLLLDAIASHSQWQAATLEQTVLLRADLQAADLSLAQLRKTVLLEANMAASRWDGARWDNVHGSSAKTNFSHASFIRTKATSCGLHGVNMAGANLSHAIFLRCDLSQANLQEAILDHGTFSYSRFMQTNLRCASLTGSDMLQTLCRKADFCAAKLADTRFHQSDLSHAILPDGQTYRRAA